MVTKSAEYNRTYRARHKERLAAKHKEWLRALREQVFSAYGRACVQCGVDDLSALTLDHVNDDGAEHRRALLGRADLGGWPFYRKLRSLGWPSLPLLQVLCASCNARKHWRRYRASHELTESSKRRLRRQGIGV